MATRWIGALALAGALAACTNELGGDLSVNGTPFEAASCRNGAVRGYRGVELTGKSGARIAIAATQTGAAHVAHFAKDADRGVEIGDCGTFQVEDQNSTVNDVKNVEGKATLDCTSGDLVIKGSVTFANCH